MTIRPNDTLLRLGDDLVVVKTERPDDGQPRLYVAVTGAKQIGTPLNRAQVRMLRDTLSMWLAASTTDTGQDWLTRLALTGQVTMTLDLRNAQPAFTNPSDA